LVTTFTMPERTWPYSALNPPRSTEISWMALRETPDIGWLFLGSRRVTPSSMKRAWPAPPPRMTSPSSTPAWRPTTSDTELNGRVSSSFAETAATLVATSFFTALRSATMDTACPAIVSPESAASTRAVWSMSTRMSLTCVFAYPSNERLRPKVPGGT
jgi:hypothetical protein